MDFDEGNTKPVILAVDDKPELLKTITGILGDKYAVIGVTSGMAAIKALNTRTPQLFLLDIEMPEINGYDLAAMIRNDSEYKNTPIIFLTAMGTRDSVIEAIQNGGNDYIVKPVEKDILLAKITKYLE